MSPAPPKPGGRQSTSCTSAPWARSASEKTSTPAATIGRRSVEQSTQGSVAEAPSRSRAYRVAAELDAKTAAPAAARASAWRLQPCGSASVPISATTTGSGNSAASRAAVSAGSSAAAGSGSAP